jgi:hypothetical protein
MTYRPMPLQRFLLPVVLIVFTGAAIGLIVATVRGSGPPIAFVVFWLFAFGWNAYWWGWRVCTEIVVDSVTLSWRTALLSRQAPVVDVVRVRVSRMTRQLAVIELKGRRPLLVPVRYGFGQLTQAISGAAPHATVDHA